MKRVTLLLAFLLVPLPLAAEPIPSPAAEVVADGGSGVVLRPRGHPSPHHPLHQVG